MGEILKYKGYTAQVSFDPEDQILVGEVLGISDSLMFHSEIASEIQEAFEVTIDSYLDFCEKCSKEPSKQL